MRWRDRAQYIRSVSTSQRPAPLDPATAAVLLTLVDNETPLWLDVAAAPARDWLAFHCGAALVTEPKPRLCTGAVLARFRHFPAGSHEAPEELGNASSCRSPRSGTGTRYRLSGPGLREPLLLSVNGLPPRIFRAVAAESRAVSARRGYRPVRRNDADRVAAQRIDRGGLSDGLCYGQRRRAGDRQCACLAGRGATRRSRNPRLSLAQIDGQLGRSVDRAMGEGSLYDRELAALAVKQAQGDLIEAAFLLRAYRTTLPRFAHS